MKNVRIALTITITIFFIPLVYGQKMKSIEIGGQLPDLSFSNVYNYHKKQLNFSDFAGKNIILDFWAGWCAPCLEQMPLLDSIQESYKEKLQVIAVTTDHDLAVKKTFDKLEKMYNIKLGPSIFTDTVLRYLFPNRIIPHYVWIGKDRKVKAITDNNQLTPKNISDFISGNDLNIPTKLDDMSDTYNYEIPLVATGQLNRGDSSFYSNTSADYKSILLPSFRGRGSEISARGTYSTGVNTPIIILYKYAYSILFPKIGWGFWEDDRFVLENFSGKDSLDFGFRTHKTESVWLQNELGKCFTYEIVFPDSTADEKKSRCMIEDLNRRFLQLKGFEVKNEERPFKYLALKSISAEDKSSTAGKRPYLDVTKDSLKASNIAISKFIETLQPYCYTNGVNLPIQNKTGKRNYVDISIPIKKASLNDINKALRKYNLQLVEEQENARMMIVVRKKR